MFAQPGEDCGPLRRTVSHEDILGRVRFADPGCRLRVILAIGPCRSGTTAMLRVFAESGIPAYSQPLKGILRHLAKGKPASQCGWELPAVPYVFVKETNGPFGLAESTLDFLQLYIDLLASRRGHAASAEGRNQLGDRLHVVIMGRDPFDTWYSWQDTFQRLTASLSGSEAGYYRMSPADLLESFVTSYHNVERLRAKAIAMSVPLTHYVLTANRTPQAATTALFRRIGLESAPRTDSWGSGSRIGSPDSLVFLTADHTDSVSGRTVQ